MTIGTLTEQYAWLSWIAPIAPAVLVGCALERPTFSLGKAGVRPLGSFSLDKTGRAPIL